MAESGVKIHGLREVNRAFRAIDKSLTVELGAELKTAAEPVATTAREKVTRYAGASVGTIRARRSGLRIFVEQGARKVTGLRSDYGALQMRTVLIPAMAEKSGEVYDKVEAVLDRWAAREGF